MEGITFNFMRGTATGFLSVYWPFNLNVVASSEPCFIGTIHPDSAWHYEQTELDSLELFSFCFIALVKTFSQISAGWRTSKLDFSWDHIGIPD